MSAYLVKATCLELIMHIRISIFLLPGIGLITSHVCKNHFFFGGKEKEFELGASSLLGRCSIT
jgi:hypothetical protein